MTAVGALLYCQQPTAVGALLYCQQPTAVGALLYCQQPTAVGALLYCPQPTAVGVLLYCPQPTAVGVLLYCPQPTAVPAFSHTNYSSPRLAILSFHLLLGLPTGHFPSPYHKAHVYKTVTSMRSAAASTAAERRFVSMSWRQFAELNILCQFHTARSANCRWHVKCFRYVYWNEETCDGWQFWWANIVAPLGCRATAHRRSSSLSGPGRLWGPGCLRQSGRNVQLNAHRD